MSWNIKEDIFIHSFFPLSVLRQVRSFFQGEVSRERSSDSTFDSQYPPLSLRTSRSGLCLLLHRLPDISVLLSFLQ